MVHLAAWTSLLVTLTLPTYSDSARILGIFVFNSKSHHSFTEAIVKGLAVRGHHMTIISHFKSKVSTPNYTELVFEDETPSYVDSISVRDASHYNGIQNMMLMIKDHEQAICETVFQMDYIKQLHTQSNEKLVDLILAEAYFTQCYNLLAEWLDVPVISVTCPSKSLGHDLIIGNPSNPATVPLVDSAVASKIQLLERLSSTLQYVSWYVGHYSYLNDYMDDMARRYYDMELPPIEILQQKVKLAFYNSHFTFTARSMVPNAVDIGGIHIQEAKTLPEDIQEFIDKAEHGVIFFSFGSTIKASTIPTERMDIIKRVFSRIPQKILWRIDDPTVAELPRNVMAGKWFPQRDILEHKQVRAFISHCGIFSSMEAIHTGTPMIAIPFSFDQHQNARELVDKQVALHVNFEEMTEESFFNAIDEIINNTQYFKEMQKLSTIFKDRPMSPLDTVIYWSEYVLRHDKASHLRTPSADMPLYEYLLLDVIVFILLIVGIIFWACQRLLQKVFVYCCSANRID